MANSYVSYTADGSTQTFTVTMPYINKDHVEAYVDGVEDTTFTWPTTSTITLTAMPDNGAVVRIVRVTPRDDRLVDFEAGNTVSEDNLDVDSQQNFFAMQEILESLEIVFEVDPSDDKWDAEGKSIKDLADPVNAQDAATKNYVDVDFVADLAAAVVAAELAETNAEVAQLDAENDAADAEVARVAAETAETNAETAETNAEAAAASVAHRNILINQDFSIWQKALSFTNPANDVYTADGYKIEMDDGAGTAPSVSVKENTTDQEDAFEQCCELEITNVGSNGAGMLWKIKQLLEDFEKYKGRTVTLSMRLKASTAITFSGNMTMYDGDGAASASIASLGTSWITYSTTYTVSTAAAFLGCQFHLVTDTGSVPSTTGSIYVQWMKLELGSDYTGPPTPRLPGVELTLCRRRRQKSYIQGVLPGAAAGLGASGFSISALNDADHGMDKSEKFIVPMIDTPTITLYDLVGNSGKVTMAAGDNIAGSVTDPSAMGFKASGTNGAASVTRLLRFHYFAEYDL